MDDYYDHLPYEDEKMSPDPWDLVNTEDDEAERNAERMRTTMRRGR